MDANTSDENIIRNRIYNLKLSPPKILIKYKG